ncbi:M23 family metallopeptidase [Curtobacterium pusillum]|uniref:M23 family metallopeptidase n=1 Tax=Curtobacterium pusillum TaxID=69373 RepID=UPI0021B60B27|nr:M23 family metallopeptidase [Curtobacterium pusillum]
MHRPLLAAAPIAAFVAALLLLLLVPGCGVRPMAPSEPYRAPATASAPAPAPASLPWVWPTGTRVVVRPWQAPADDYSAGHRGLDVPAPIGTAAVAVADGTVTFAGQVGGRGVVTIDHGGGLVSTLDSVAPAVTVGDTVVQGEELGTVSVGHCPASDPCLHLGARLDERYVDPTPYLPPAEWPVLLPDAAWPVRLPDAPLPG